MPCQSSRFYRLTYRPLISEFNETKDIVIKRLMNTYDNYVFSYESAGKKEVNHIEGVIGFDTDKRADKVRSQFKSKIMTDITLENYKVGVNLKPLTTNENRVIGYVVKEQTDLSNVHFSGFTQDYLLQCKEEYERYVYDKNAEMNKIHINLNNLPDRVLNYMEHNYATIKDKMPIEIPDTLESFKSVVNRKHIAFILDLMVNDGYQLLRIANGKRDYILNYISDYINTDKIPEIFHNKFMFTVKKSNFDDGRLYRFDC